MTKIADFAGIAESSSLGRITGSLEGEELGRLIIAVHFREAEPTICETLFLHVSNVTEIKAMCIHENLRDTCSPRLYMFFK